MILFVLIIILCYIFLFFNHFLFFVDYPVCVDSFLSLYVCIMYCCWLRGHNEANHLYLLTLRRIVYPQFNVISCPCLSDSRYLRWYCLDVVYCCALMLYLAVLNYHGANFIFQRSKSNVRYFCIC